MRLTFTVTPYVVSWHDGQESFETLAEARRKAKQIAEEQDCRVYVENRDTGRTWEVWA